MSFKDFFFAMSIPEREAYAERGGTTRGLLTQVAYGNKPIELGFADVLVALSKQQITLDDLPLTQNAQRQRRIRETPDQTAQAEGTPGEHAGAAPRPLHMFSGEVDARERRGRARGSDRQTDHRERHG